MRNKQMMEKQTRNRKSAMNSLPLKNRIAALTECSARKARNVSADAQPAIFEHTFPVRYHELDSHGNVSPVTLLNYLQDTAGLHATRLGIAVSDLRRQGLTWVLSRLHLVITHYPRAEESVLIRTWPATRQVLFSCREFELSGTGGIGV